MSGKKIAFFDLDGTITTKDTLLEMIRFIKGKRSFLTGFVLHAPWLIAYKLNLFPNDQMKQKMLRYFFGGMREVEFQTFCDSFAETKLPALIRMLALIELSELKGRGFEIVIVSASAGNWIRKWTERNGFSLVATILEIREGVVTGNFVGRNCYGQEKVNRIKAIWDLSEYGEVYAYGDSSGDRPMLALASASFYKPFRAR